MPKIAKGQFAILGIIKIKISKSLNILIALLVINWCVF